MTEAFEVDLPDGGRGSAVRLLEEDGLDGAIASLRLPRGPVVILLGGAAKVGEADVPRIRAFLATSLIPAIDDLHGMILDGGTDVGVMRMAGEERLRGGRAIRLVGVAPFDKVMVEGSPGRTPLARGHTDFVLVPGTEWGDEMPWFDLVADQLMDRPPTNVLVNGGPIALQEVRQSIDHGRRVIVVDGTGRAADDLAASAAATASLAIEVVDVTIGPDEFINRLAKLARE